MQTDNRISGETPDYEAIINSRAQVVFDAMQPRISDAELFKLRDAFELAREAHRPQRRKTGEPYILHPVAVATIAAVDLMLDVNSVCAAFLHDVVEDTPVTVGELRTRFGDDIAFLVGVVTKRKKEHYRESKQVDNYRQMLESVQYDIRAVLVKLADRLHNMRTLSSMPPAKQMKIAGETDYFYAPLANRLGLYNVKTELENLGLLFRCRHEYEEIEKLIANDRAAQSERLERFAQQIRETVAHAGLPAEVRIVYRRPYSIWRKMRKKGLDFNHLEYRHFTDIVFPQPEGMTEKDMALRIYSALTDRFKEKPGGISNYIDSPKENGYQSFHLKLLPDFGRWQEVHISSERMVRNSQLGPVAQRSEDNIRRWIDKFRGVLADISDSPDESHTFMENVVTSFYNDDIMTFTKQGKPVVLPQRATALDFAYEVDPELGEHARYARVNGFLASVKSPLRRGDVVEVFTSPDSHPTPDWLDAAVSYKARRAIRNYLDAQPIPVWIRCRHCMPIPGEEVLGFREEDGRITIHKRDCPLAIRMASQQGDNIVSADFDDDMRLYPVTIRIRAVDRYHLLIDLVDCITNQLHLAMASFNTDTVDNIVTVTISLSVHSFAELEWIISHISAITGVDEVKRIK